MGKNPEQHRGENVVTLPLGVSLKRPNGVRQWKPTGSYKRQSLSAGKADRVMQAWFQSQSYLNSANRRK